MEIRLLGSVEVSAHGRPVVIRAGKPRALLALLALHSGSVVSAQRLIDGLWGEDPPATAPKMVHVLVSQLRKSLAAAGDGDGDGRIVTLGHGYELVIDPSELDVRRFERLLDAGAAREALAQWHGPALEDVADEPFAAAEIRRLEELRLAAVERVVAQDLEDGHPARALAELEAVMPQAPLHEGLHAKRILALYRCGRQAEALQAYRHARRTLVDEIGIEPGPELRRLHDAVLRQDPALHGLRPGDAGSAVPPPAPADERRLADVVEHTAVERAALRAAEDELAGAVLALRADGPRPAAPGPAASGPAICPFKGLAAYEADDAAFFCGRERLVADMVARLAGAPLLCIAGPSGCGKSSALRAGLLPALAEGVLPGSATWSVALRRPGEHPLAMLRDVVDGTPEDRRLVLAIDQFEELFTACPDEQERAAFADALARAVRGERRIHLLVTLRADASGRCAAYPELWRLLGANLVPVGPMAPDELRRAIEVPVARAGLTIEPRLVDALITDVHGEPGALPLLSTSLLELWRDRDGPCLRMAQYEHVHGVHGAVARLAERAYAELDAPGRVLARRILLRLTTEGDGGVVCRRAPVAEFEVEGMGAVLESLVDHRLVAVGDGDVEITHEALLDEWPRLRGWLEEDAHGRRLRHGLHAAAQDWDVRGRDRDDLYRGARLAAALDWAAGPEAHLPAIDRMFLDASRAAGFRAYLRLRGALAGAVVLLLIALLAGAVALHQRDSARTEARTADAQRLGTRALVEDDLDRALLLAREGVALDDSPLTRGNLLAVLARSPAAIGVLRGDGERMWTLALSPDERTLAAGDPAGRVYLYDVRRRRRRTVLQPGAADAWIVQLAFSPDGRWLAIAHDGPGGSRVAVADVAARRIRRTLRPPADGTVSALRYATARTLDVVTGRPGTDAGPALLTRFDPRDGRRRLGPRAVTRRSWSPLLATRDGRRLVTADPDGITVRDAATLAVVRRHAVPERAGPRWPGAYALAPDDTTLAVGEADGAVGLVDLRSGAVRATSIRHDAAVKAARFTSDGRRLVTAGEDRDIRVMELRESLPGETLSGHASGVADLQVTDDRRTLYSAGLDGTVIVWDLDGTRRLGRPFRLGSGDPDRPLVAQSADSSLMATGQADGAVGVVDARTLRPRAPVPVVPTGPVLALGFVPGSHLLAVGGPAGFLALADADSGRVIARLRGHRGAVVALGTDAGGSMLATGSEDGTVRLWSLPRGRALRPPLRLAGDVQDTRLSPDGRRLVVVVVEPGAERSRLEIRESRRLRRVHELRIPGRVRIVRFSPDARLLAVGHRTYGTRVLSATTWRPVTGWFGGDASGITGIAISPDGRTLAAGSDTGIVRVWDIASQQSIGAPLPGVPSRPVVPSFSRDGRRLVAAYDDGRAFAWDVRPSSLVRRACAVAGRRLTRTEWDQFMPRRPFDPAC